MKKICCLLFLGLGLCQQSFAAKYTCKPNTMHKGVEVKTLGLETDGVLYNGTKQLYFCGVESTNTTTDCQSVDGVGYNQIADLETILAAIGAGSRVSFYCGSNSLASNIWAE